MPSPIRITIAEIVTGAKYEFTFPYDVRDASTKALRDLTDWGPVAPVFKRSPTDAAAAATGTLAFVAPAVPGLTWRVTISLTSTETAKLGAADVQRVFGDALGLPPASSQTIPLFVFDAPVRKGVSV